LQCCVRIFIVSLSFNSLSTLCNLEKKPTALKLESDNFEVVPVCKPEEILLYGNFDRKQVIVLDDVLGIYSVDITI
jgi:hypothetical protein